MRKASAIPERTLMQRTVAESGFGSYLLLNSARQCGVNLFLRRCRCDALQLFQTLFDFVKAGVQLQGCLVFRDGQILLAVEVVGIAEQAMRAKILGSRCYRALQMLNCASNLAPLQVHLAGGQLAYVLM